MSSDPEFKLIHSIEDIESDQIDSTSYLVHSKKIPVARLVLLKQDVSSRQFFPWLPESYWNLDEFYNLTKDPAISKALVQFPNLNTKGIAAALLRWTLQKLVQEKILSVDDYIWLNACGISDTGKCDLLGLVRYYESIGFSVDSKYIDRFRRFYSENQKYLDKDGCLLEEFKLLWEKKSYRMETHQDEYLDPTNVPMSGKIQDILNSRP